MGSVGGEVAKKAIWLYPKVMGFNPTERWGHSACYADGFIYVFGGCCGGLHFSDVLVLNLDTMAWNTLVSTGHGPGPRDSHSAVLVGQRMIVFGGTNGSKKVNDLHILDLSSREWTRPDCKGVPPSPRESHTATLVGDDKLVIFGGSGEGEANYLNDLHVLGLKTMMWTSPEVKGNVPAPRDSHSAVAVGSKIFVYGGDCGDRYEGDIDILDTDTLIWSRLIVQGSSPGVRAGHAAVSIGPKVYILGGVGDKQYYNDVWVLDANTCVWTRLDIRGQQPHGRFSHTAIVSETDIAIYGGCGEDERPVNELLVLQLGAEHPNGRYNISLCKIFGNHCNKERRKISREARNISRAMSLGNNREVVRKEHLQQQELDSRQPSQISSDAFLLKRKRTSSTKTWEIESEPEEHSLSLSQHSSPSQSDQEQTPVKKTAHSIMASHVLPLFKHDNQIPSNGHSSGMVPSNQVNSKSFVRRSPQDFNFSREHQNQPNSDHYLQMVHMGRHGAQFPATEQKPSALGPFHNLVGAELRGKIDAAFDSGYLMTATVNGKIFRGVLFAPGPEVMARGAIQYQSSRSMTTQRANVPQPSTHVNCSSPTFTRHPQQPITHSVLDSGQNVREAHMTRASPVIRATSSIGNEPKVRSDLQGVVLTLGGPGGGHGGA